MARTHLRRVAPTTVNGTVTTRRRPNAELRSREHLTETEVERLMKAAGALAMGHGGRRPFPAALARLR
jgi:type 1 fimbriae regulatory protein FimB/type 1 fimbriae regulatory protein FimE